MKDRKEVRRSCTPLIFGVIWWALMLRPTDAFAVLLFLLGAFLIAAFLKALYGPVGLFEKLVITPEQVSVTYVLRKKTTVINIDENTHFYLYKRMLPTYVISKEPLANRKEAKRKAREGAAVFMLGDCQLLGRHTKNAALLGK